MFCIKEFSGLVSKKDVELPAPVLFFFCWFFCISDVINLKLGRLNMFIESEWTIADRIMGV